MNPNPPERPQYLDRRNFLGVGATSIVTSAFAMRAMAQTDVVDETLQTLREKYPHLRTAGAVYDKKIREQIAGKSNPYLLEKSSNIPRLPVALETMVRHMAAGFRLDPLVLSRLVLNETGGQPNLVSHKGAQGLTQIMPVTLQDFYKRLDTRYAAYLRRLPTNFAEKFTNKDMKYAIHRIVTNKEDIKNIREGINILGGSIFDTEANLFLGSLYLAGLKGEIVTEGVNTQRIHRVLTGFSAREIAIVNAHRARIGAPTVPAESWSQVCDTKLANTPGAAVYIEALARYNGGGSISQPPVASAYGYAGSILI